MRTTLKLVLPLAFSVVSVSLLYGFYQVRLERRNLRNDLAHRSAVLAASLQENLESSGKANDRTLSRFVEKYGQREHLVGVVAYDDGGQATAITHGLSANFTTQPPVAARAATTNKDASEFVDKGTGNPLQLYAVPLHRDGKVSGSLMVVNDSSYIDAQVMRAVRDSLLNTLIQTLLITGLAFFLVKWAFTSPLTKTAKWLRSLRADPFDVHAAPPQGEIFDLIHAEARHLARDLSSARAAAQEEALLRESQLSQWTAERLRVSLQTKLQGDALFVVSNREPYMHVYDEKGQIRLLVPASGLVTALEPVLQACQGTWIANGSGNADRDVVDAKDHLLVPPHHPTYSLRRVWLSQEEDRGYYEGFSNEGLWPLCHIAHTRPLFRPGDWMYYQRINRRFADAALEEMAGTQSPILLVQDYHFALLPRMVKESRPDVRVAVFWHIPWPNAEAFGICPWQRELVDGLLGADLVGFHIQTHCNNFLQTVDRALEALSDWDRFEVSRQGHITRVRPYPISVAFPQERNGQVVRITGEGRAALFSELGVEASLLGVGVDRVDYTKGIVERFRGIERFLELYPIYQRRFTFVQIGAPSRTDIPRYQQFLDEVTAEADRINTRLQAGRWKPIVFLKRHHSHEEIEHYFRAASVCMVTSLHDGMNLVAKEFVASRDDNRGALILSTFTGAARELSDALLVNPYDVDQVANAIYQALEFSEEEQSVRMSRMRKMVYEHNVYRWASNLLSDLTDIRVDSGEKSAVARAS
jgi:trehalose-6-phosphate synthase